MTSSLTAADRVTWLLKTLNDARHDYGEPSTGDGVRLMPSTYHQGSYAELEHCLTRMHLEQHTNHWHTSSRYRWGETQTITVPVRQLRKGPELQLPPHCELVSGQATIGHNHARVRVYRWDPRVDQHRVNAGIRWLTKTMHGGHRNRIVLPDALYRKALNLPPRETEKYRALTYATGTV